MKVSIQPKLENLPGHPYVAIPATVSMREIPHVLPALIPQVLEWAEKNGNQQVGPVFFRYLKMAGEMLEVEVGVPTKNALKGDATVKPGAMPGGRYATVTFMGHYNNLPQVHAQLEQWGKEQGLKVMGNRVEYYPTDPDTEPNPDKWQTDIIVQVVD